MKLSIVLLLFTYTSLWASDVSGQRINLDLKEASIEKVLQAIREQGRYSFVYQSQIFPQDLKINIRTKNASIDSVMEKLLLNTPLYYKKIDRNLFVILTRNIPPPVSDVRRPPIVVRGSVKDRAGGMLQNVSVYVKGTQNGTLTNEKENSLLMPTCMTALKYHQLATKRSMFL